MITELIAAHIIKVEGLSFWQRYKLQCWHSTNAYRYIAFDCMAFDLMDKIDVPEGERRQIAFNTVKDLTNRECTQYVLEREFTFEITTI